MRSIRIRPALMTTAGLVALAAACCGVPWIIRQRQEREGCRSHIRIFASSLRGYESVHGTFPPGTISGGSLPPEQRMSWVWPVLLFSDSYQGFRYLFETNRPWDSPENRLPRIKELAIPGHGSDKIVDSLEPPVLPNDVTCPANHCEVAKGVPGPIHYVGIAGVGLDAPTLPAGHPRRDFWI